MLKLKFHVMLVVDVNVDWVLKQHLLIYIQCDGCLCTLKYLSVFVQVTPLQSHLLSCPVQCLLCWTLVRTRPVREYGRLFASLL